MLAKSKFQFPEGNPDRRENTIVSVLEKPNDKRTQDDIELLVVLIKNLEFFQTRDIREKNYPEIVSCLKLERMKVDQTVFNMGEEGKHFYVIIKGTVSVLMPNTKIFDNIKKLQAEVNQFLKFKPKSFIKEQRRKNTISDYDRSSQGEGEDEEHEDHDDYKINRDKKAHSKEHRDSREHRDSKDLNQQTINRVNSHASIRSNTDSKKNEDQSNPRASRMSVNNMDDLNPVQRLEMWENEPDEICVAKLTNGMSFGEIALIEDKPRGATIRCDND